MGVWKTIKKVKRISTPETKRRLRRRAKWMKRSSCRTVRLSSKFLEVGNATQQDDKQASKADENCAGVELENCDMEDEVQQESKIEQPEKDHKKVPFWRPWEGG